LYIGKTNPIILNPGFNTDSGGACCRDVNLLFAMRGKIDSLAQPLIAIVARRLPGVQ
jgi:hypothetical protein